MLKDYLKKNLYCLNDTMNNLLLLIMIILSFLNGYQNDHLVNASLALNSGMYEEALVHLSESKIKNPADPQIYKIEGLLHETLGNNKKAIQSWKNCLKYSKGEQKLIEESKNHLKNLLID